MFGNINSSFNVFNFKFPKNNLNFFLNINRSLYSHNPLPFYAVKSPLSRLCGAHGRIRRRIFVKSQNIYFKIHIIPD